MIGNVSVLLTLVVIGHCNQNISSGESIEAIIAPSFNMRLIPNLVLLADTDDLLDENVERIIRIHRGPECFTVEGIVATVESLL